MMLRQVNEIEIQCHLFNNNGTTHYIVSNVLAIFQMLIYCCSFIHLLFFSFLCSYDCSLHFTFNLSVSGEFESAKIQLWLRFFFSLLLTNWKTKWFLIPSVSEFLLYLVFHRRFASFACFHSFSVTSLTFITILNHFISNFFTYCR